MEPTLVEFGILGSLSVTASGVAVPIGAPKVRILLATLLLRANDSVSIDELTQRLWEDSSPRDAKAAVQTYVMRLRTVLGEAGQLVETRPSGYAIVVPPESLDLARYRMHRERARMAEAAGDLCTESDELRAAITLWRGQPLSDVNSAWLQRYQVPALVEDHLQVLERRIDVDLALGRHAEVVGELRGLVVEHRFREGMWYRLILALYRSQCQAEALEAYQSVRTALHDELGVEPCEELERLHRQVLRRDRQLDVPMSASRDIEPRAAVFQLPSASADFVGLEDTVDRILAELTPSQGGATVSIVILSGPPGVGKTALAIQVGHRLRDAYPDGCLYMNMRGFSNAPPATASEALVRFLRALGVPPDQIPTDTDEQAAFFRAVLADRRFLLVLDNVANARQARPMIPGTAGSAVIITSRHKLDGLVATNAARCIPLNPMTPQDATSLLTAVLGGRVQDEPDAAATIARLCGYLPLALRIAAASLATKPTWPLASYAAWLSAENRVLALAMDDDIAVERAFDLSYKALDPDLARLFRLLSSIPGPTFDRYPAANLMQVDPIDAGRMLDRLVAVNLLQSHAPERYHFHDLIASYAGLLLGRIDEAAAGSDACRRMFLYYLHTASLARRLLHPELPELRPPDRPAGLIVRELTSQSDARAWLDAEAVNLEAIIRDPRRTDQPLWVLADAMLVHVERYDRAWLEMFLPVQAAAERYAGGTARAAVNQGLAKLYRMRCEFAEARDYFQRAANASRDAADIPSECRATNGLACVATDMEEYGEAVELYRRALALLERTGDETSQIGILTSLGMTMVLLGRDPEALQALKAADTIARDRGFAHVHPTVRSGIAFSAHWRGRLKEAAQGFSDALEMWRGQRVGVGQAEALRNLAEVQLEAGRAELATRLARESSSLSERIGDPWMEVGATATLGQAALVRGQRDLAHELFLNAQQMHPSGPRYWNSFITLGLAGCTRLAGDAERAVELATGVVADQRPRYSGQGHLERGRAHLMLGNTDAAMTDADAAVQIARIHDYVLAEAHALDLRAQVWRNLGRRSPAEESEVRSRELLASIAWPE